MIKIKIRNLLILSIIPILFIISLFDHKDIINPSILTLYALLSVSLILANRKMVFKSFLCKYNLLITIPIIISLATSIYNQISFISNHIFYFDAIIQQFNGILFLSIGIYIYRYHYNQFNISMRAISFISLCSAAYGLIQAIIYYITNNSILRIKSFFYNPIPAGTVWAMCIFLPLTGHIVPDLILKSFYIAAIFLCQSRSSWVAFTIGIILYIIINRQNISKYYIAINKKYRILLWIILVIVLAIIIHVPEINTVLTNRLFNIKSGSSGEAYVVRSSHAFYLMNEIIHDSPIFMVIGHAVGSVGRLFRNSPLWQYSGYDVVDNTYLSILYEYGLLMLISVLYVLVKAIIVLLRSIKKVSCISKNDTTYALMLVIGAITAIFYDLQFSMTPTLLMMLMASTVLTSKSEH